MQLLGAAAACLVKEPKISCIPLNQCSRHEVEHNKLAYLLLL